MPKATNSILHILACKMSTSIRPSDMHQVYNMKWFGVNCEGLCPTFQQTAYQGEPLKMLWRAWNAGSNFCLASGWRCKNSCMADSDSSQVVMAPTALSPSMHDHSREGLLACDDHMLVANR